MGFHKINTRNLVTPRVETTPTNVGEANKALFHATMNLPQAAAHCGMSEREMKMTFREYLKTHGTIYSEVIQLPLPL